MWCGGKSRNDVRLNSGAERKKSWSWEALDNSRANNP